MKLDLRYVAVIVLGIIALNCVLRLRTVDKNNGNPWKVYGSMYCGWTRKQIEELKNKGVDYEFHGCSGNRCKEGMPENVLPNGTRHVGFTKAG